MSKMWNNPLSKALLVNQYWNKIITILAAKLPKYWFSKKILIFYEFLPYKLHRVITGKIHSYSILNQHL